MPMMTRASTSTLGDVRPKPDEEDFATADANLNQCSGDSDLQHRALCPSLTMSFRTNDLLISDAWTRYEPWQV